jgi:hypothetical protein
MPRPPTFLLLLKSKKGNDAINTTTWFNFDYQNDNREPTYRRTRFTWNYFIDKPSKYVDKWS